MPEETPDLIFASKTQTSAELEKVLSGEGFTEFQGSDLSDSAGEAPAPPPEPPPAAPEPAEPPAGEPPAEPPAGEPPAKKSGAQRHKEEKARLQAEIDRMEQERQDVLAEKDLLAREVEELRKKPAAGEPPAEHKVDTDPEPKEEDFPDELVKYLEAKSRWAVRDERRKESDRQRLADEQAASDRKTQAAQEAESRNAASRKAIDDHWNQAVSKAQAAHPDWNEKMAAARGRVVGPPAMLEALKVRDDGGELAFWLCSHPEVENQVAALVKLPDNPTEFDIRRAVRIADRELDRLAEQHKIGTSSDPKPAAAPPAPAAPPAAPPAAAPAHIPTPAVPAKPAPPSMVGQRGQSGYRTYNQLSMDEQRAMSMDEFRKRQNMGEV